MGENKGKWGKKEKIKGKTGRKRGRLSGSWKFKMWGISSDAWNHAGMTIIAGKMLSTCCQHTFHIEFKCPTGVLANYPFNVWKCSCPQWRQVSDFQSVQSYTEELQFGNRNMMFNTIMILVMKSWKSDPTEFKTSEDVSWTLISA